jgi:hypothetical protein
MAGGERSEAAAEALQQLFDEGATEHARQLEFQPSGRLYRAELARLGLPQPETLRGVDVIGETIRLVVQRGFR